MVNTVNYSGSLMTYQTMTSIASLATLKVLLLPYFFIHVHGFLHKLNYEIFKDKVCSFDTMPLMLLFQIQYVDFDLQVLFFPFIAISSVAIKNE